MRDIGRPKAGETGLVVTSAGAVGSVTAQIAQSRGCGGIGIAGGAEKCARLVADFGLGAAIDYRGKDLVALTEAIRAVAPDGVDIYFDNVGGIQLEDRKSVV